MLTLPLHAAILADPVAAVEAPAVQAPRAVEAADLQPGGGALVAPVREEDLASLAQDARAAVDAGLADLILSTAALLADEPPAASPRADLRWRLQPIAPDYGGSTIAGQTAQQFGSSDGVAVTWRHEIDGSATLSNAIRVSHASGPIDTQLAVIGRVSVLQGGPMALSYRSSTTLAVLPFFSVGADAHGPLGTLSAIRPGTADSVIEPRMKFSLPVLGAVAGATTGWRVPTGAAASNDPDKRTEFHWKLTFQKKL